MVANRADVDKLAKKEFATIWKTTENHYVFTCVFVRENILAQIENWTDFSLNARQHVPATHSSWRSSPPYMAQWSEKSPWTWEGSSWWRPLQSAPEPLSPPSCGQSGNWPLWRTSAGYWQPAPVLAETIMLNSRKVLLHMHQFRQIK